ncbi:MAG TPA: CHASE3 domain-containing protein [Gammaproteobacteria bacterium]|nr:CHASE3 domain-containing protein [Gammaproteobacteria bacterium]
MSNLKFFCTLGILATITAFSFSLISNFVSHEAEVGRSFETLAKTDWVLTLMLNAETDTCGYLITLRERFLQPFFTKNILPRTLRSLGAAISARPKQHHRCHQLARLTAQALASIDSRITLKCGTALHERI